ncbi:MAG: hypothetical protein HYU41_01010 [Candidatus Rokubacteria bacterium]|nr:hypothetical protein [Candidatus Rokubacteria bacterium]
MLVGVVLRLTMLWSFPPEAGYDYPAHWTYITWLERERGLPTLTTTIAATHPPVFYAVAAALVHWGGGPPAVQAISVVAGIARLAFVWIGLEVVMPGARVARRVALALAATLPVAVHLDGTVNGESLCATFVALALIFVPAALGDGRRAIVAAATVGLVLGVAVLTKVTAVTVGVAIVFGAAARFVVEARRGRTDPMRLLAPVVVGVAVFVATTGWWVAWNQGFHGKPLPTYADQPGLRYMPATLVVPVWLRRTPDFYFGWTNEIYAMPYYPSASLERSRFVPQLIASTFVDYYNYAFAPARPGAPTVVVNNRPLPATAVTLGRASMVAGTVIVVVTVLASVAALARTWSAQAWAPFACLLVPLGALAVQVYYAQVFPHDMLGIVKGAYLLYAAPPMFAAFGLGVAWLARRARALAALPLAALGVVAAYTIWCRTA